MKTTYVKPDSRNRIVLTKAVNSLAPLYKIYTEDNKIILEPIEDNKEEKTHWLLKPENKKLLEKLERALKQETKPVKWKDIKGKYQ